MGRTSMTDEIERAEGMIAAFRQSLKYGFRPGSLRLLIEGYLKIGGRR